MVTITTRSAKGSALTWTEVDNNFTNLNNGKLETSVLDPDPTLAADSNLLIATQAATKSYTDALRSDLLASTGSALVTFTASGTGAAARTVQAKLRDMVSVKDFGAVGDGVTDDTAAIEAAHTASAGVYYPIGTYVYNGTGITRTGDISLVGAGLDLVTILISAGNYFLDGSVGLYDALRVEGFTFSGGRGAIRNSLVANLIGRRKIICNNRFVDYTECAINLNANDNPYWLISNNEFFGANSVSTIGIALARNADNSLIMNNSFSKNAVGIKLNASGIVNIESNDFLHFDAGSGRTFIWVLGNNTNSTTFIQNGNKFGSENLAASDYRISVVPEGSGADNGSKLPDYTATSIVGEFPIIVRNNRFSGVTGNGPLLYTVSNKMYGTEITENNLTGTLPSYLVQYGMATFTDNPYECLLLGNNYNSNQIAVAPNELTNVGYYGNVMDDYGFQEGDARNPGRGENLARVGYTEMLTTRINSFSLATTTKIGAVTDATGGTDAAEFSVADGSDVYAGWAVAPTPGEVFWVEFDLCQGSASPVSLIEVGVFSFTANSPSYWARRCRVSTDWRTFRFPVSIAGSQASRFRFRGVSTGQIKIGRVRVYASRTPIAFGISTLDALKFSGGLGDYANDAAAAAAGIQIGQLYRTGTAVQIRVV